MKAKKTTLGSTPFTAALTSVYEFCILGSSNCVPS